jgi:hypothetical protein
MGQVGAMLCRVALPWGPVSVQRQKKFANRIVEACSATINTNILHLISILGFDSWVCAHRAAKFIDLFVLS